ncbi:hypothetical protein [Crateriforma conspicua]|uniref:hypothetical protein n=1 Tax=Crateriforma conspicua TaxID=2527996 RepID=UPI00118BCA16|nr:hypothetical protein [Crateriforma conspicua]QDV61065.1 hypothetical protein Mal65_01880 [Crateriforma conspicua]
MNYTQHYIIDRHEKTLFVPWAFLLTLGGCWAVSVPPDANRTLLTNVLWWFHLAVVAIPLSAFVIAKLVGLSAVHLITGSWLVVVLLYTLGVIYLIAGWRRVSFRDTVQYMYVMGDNGSVSLLRQVLFGLFAIALVLLFRLTEHFVIAFCAIALVNSALAAIVLLRRSHVSA